MKAKLIDPTFWYSTTEHKWFMSLTYEYDDETGTHEALYPKVEVPVTQSSLPEVEYCVVNSLYRGLPLNPYIKSTPFIPLYSKDIIDPITRKVEKSVFLYTHTTKEAK